MKMYSKIPGRRILGHNARDRVWLGPDHLLYVKKDYYAESYRRFYFSDIEAFIIELNRFRLFANLILIALATLIVWPMALYFPPKALPYAMLVLIPFALIILINSLRGQGCRFYIQTAAHVELFHPIVRVSAARKLLRLIQPRLLAAQPPMTEEELAARLAAFPIVIERPETLHLHPPSKAHVALFALLALQGVISLIGVFTNGKVLVMVDLIAGVALVLTAITAASMQYQKPPTRGIIAVTWSAIGYLIIFSAIAWVSMVVLAAMGGATHTNQTALRYLSALSKIDPATSWGFRTINILSAASAFTLAAFGFALLARRR